MQTICVIGGGLAGTIAALSAIKHGFKVELHEKREEPSRFGAGIQISPNAKSVLDSLNIRVEKFCIAPDAMHIYSRNIEEPILSYDLQESFKSRFGADYLVCHRAALHEALWQACESEKDILLFTASCGPKRDEFDKYHAIIGADGVHSEMRQLIEKDSRAVYSGYSALRALTPRDPQIGNNIELHWGNDAHSVIYPIDKKTSSIVVPFKHKLLATKTEPKTDPALIAQVQARLGNKYKLPQSGPEAGPKAGPEAEYEYSLWPIFTAPKLAKWHNEKLCLIGDAAHAMPPFAAQGAAAALEDGWQIAQSIASYQTAQKAFANFEENRKQRTQKLAKLARQNGRIYHAKWPIANLRNLAVGQNLVDPFKRFEDIYNWRPS